MSSRRVESFLLRLVVQEEDEASAEGWRGRIQHVSSGYERQFEHLQDMIAFISEQLVVAGSSDAGYDEQAVAE
jgi:hypothetical protein